MAQEARLQLIESFKVRFLGILTICKHRLCLEAVFQEVCGVDEDEIARDFLERCEWELEVKAFRFLY